MVKKFATMYLSLLIGGAPACTFKQENKTAQTMTVSNLQIMVFSKKNGVRGVYGP
jgi:hypothetical protein